jgi:hypothetical protein
MEQAASSCEQGNELSNSIIDVEFVDHLIVMLASKEEIYTWN